MERDMIKSLKSLRTLRSQCLEQGKKEGAKWCLEQIETLEKELFEVLKDPNEDPKIFSKGE